MEGTQETADLVADAPPDESKDPKARLWKVFVSSTSRGLGGFRAVARDVIDNFRFDGVKCFEPVVMERFGAQAAAAREVCEAEVRECDLLVGILGIRYGDHPPDDQTSYTELEFDTAAKARISPLMFLLNKKVAAGVERARRQGEDRANRQQKFRKRALDGLVVETDVISEADFREKLGSALDKWVRDYSFTREMVDHSAEFKAARRRLLSLGERTGGAALIFGEPGTGKTTLFNALLYDTLLKRSFPHLIGPVTVRLAAGPDEVRQRQAEVQSAITELAGKQAGGRDALPAVLIALHLEPDIKTGIDVDPGTLGMLTELFTWDIPRAVVLAETNNHSVRERLEQALGWPPGTVTTLEDYIVVKDALEQMRRDAPKVRKWPLPDTEILAEALGMRPISLFAAAKDIEAQASRSPSLIPDVIQEQLGAIAHEESREGKYAKLVQGNIGHLSPDARELLALLTVLHPKPTLFPDEMAVALDLSLTVDEAIAIATAEDSSKLKAEERRHLRQAYKLVAELVGRGLLERMPAQEEGQDERELLTLHPANVRVIRDCLALSGEKRAEGHARAEAFYRARVGEAVSGSFHTHFRMENPAWWDDVEQWIYHLGHTAPDRAGISFATLFMDAYWWWDLYVEFDFCRKLLEYANRPRVQAVSTEMPEVTRLLGEFRKTYPREHESTRGEILAEIAGDDPARAGQLRETAQTGAGIIPILQQLCLSLGITELDGLFDDQASRQSQPAGPAKHALEAAGQTRLHMLGLLCLFLAEGHRFRAFLNPKGTALKTATACYLTAEACFGAEESDWDLAWTRYLHGEVVSALRRNPGSRWDKAADGGHAESDTELLGNIERARADHLRAHGDLEAALTHYGRAVFYGLTQQVTSNLELGADAYTQAFYREMRLHAAKVLVESLLADPLSPDEARHRLDVMLGQWGGHWKPVPGPLNKALRSASQKKPESADAVADAAFFPGPGDAVLLKPDLDYYRRVNDLVEKIGQQSWVKGLDRWKKYRAENAG